MLSGRIKLDDSGTPLPGLLVMAPAWNLCSLAGEGHFAGQTGWWEEDIAICKTKVSSPLQNWEMLQWHGWF